MLVFYVALHVIYYIVKNVFCFVQELVRNFDFIHIFLFIGRSSVAPIIRIFIVGNKLNCNRKRVNSAFSVLC